MSGNTLAWRSRELYRGDMPISGLGSVTCAEVVPYEAIRAATEAADAICPRSLWKCFSGTTILPLKELRQVSMDWARSLVRRATTLTESNSILRKEFLCTGESLLFSQLTRSPNWLRCRSTRSLWSHNCSRAWAMLETSWSWCPLPVMGQGGPPWLSQRHEETGKARRGGPCTAMPDPQTQPEGTACVEGKSRHESKYPSGQPLQTNPGVGCIWWWASASTSWMGAWEGPNSRFADPGLAEGHRLSRYDEVRAVKLLPHLGWRDRLDCILCQEDSSLLTQDKCVSDCHRSLESAAELGRSPGELNHIAESDCANEPAGRVGQRKPLPQTLCEWHQRDNRHTRGGAAEGSRAGWYRRRRILTHPHQTPQVPGGTGQRCVERHCVSQPQSLGCWLCKLWLTVLTGFGRETRTIPLSGGVLQAQVHRNRTLPLGNINVPPSRPAIEGSEDGGGRRAASGRKKGPSTTSSAPRALPGRKEPGQGVVASHSPCWGANHLAVRARDWEVCTPPARSRGGPGKHGRQLWVQFGGRRRGGQSRRIFILRGRLPIPRCCDRHLILYRRAEWNAGHAMRRHSRITREPQRTASAGGVKGPLGLARRKGSHCNPQIAQSTSRWFSARVREASAGSDRGSPSHTCEERERTHKPSTNAASARWMPRHWRQWSWLSMEDRKRPQPRGHGRNGVFKKTRTNRDLLF